MPNHVMNIIELKGDEQRIQELREAVKMDKHGVGTLDFNKVIPMPESLQIEAGSSTEKGLEAYRDFLEVYTLGGTTNMDKLSEIPIESEKAFLKMRSDINRNDWKLGKVAWNNLQQYGAPTWYEWSIQHWGTKWNSYGYGEGEFETAESDHSILCFQTAWSPPHPILERLSMMFHDVALERSWADEDIGANCGRFSYSGGERTEEYLPEHDVEALEFAAEIWGEDLYERGYIKNATGTQYIYVDDEKYELIELNGQPALFTNERLHDSDIPEGLHCYHLRESDDGDHFCSIEPKVGVNHGGSVIVNEAIDFGEQGYIAFTEDTSPNFLGEHISLRDFMDGNFEQNGGMKLE